MEIFDFVSNCFKFAWYKELCLIQTSLRLQKLLKWKLYHAYICFFAGTVDKKIELAQCGSDLSTLLGLVKPHNTCYYSSCDQGFQLASGTYR